MTERKRTQLACNDHPPLRQLLDEGRAEVDFLKITSLTDLEQEVTSALRYRSALVHVGFGLEASAASYADLDWGCFNNRVRRSGTPHVAMHLEVSTKNWSGATDLRYQSGEEAERMVRQLTELCRLLRNNLTSLLVLENMDYMGTELRPSYGVYRINVEPALMWQLVEEEGVGVLLDLAHLRITASHLGVKPKAFVRTLPLHAVQEIHVCGPVSVEGVGLRDDYQEMAEEDYTLLEWTLERTNPKVVTLEYPKSRTVKQSCDEQAAAFER